MARPITHGLTGTRLNRIYAGIKARCNNPRRKDYAHYGGRGIKVCNEWETNASKFYAWALSNGYNDNLSLERKDVDKGYNPQNCAWVDNTAQNLNQRIQVNNTSGVVGVFQAWDKARQKYYWRAKIKFRGVVYRKGFPTFDECVQWRKDMEKMIFEKYGYRYDYKPNDTNTIKIHKRA